MEKKKTPNVFATDPISMRCQKTGLGRDVVIEMIAREDREKKVEADRRLAREQAKAERLQAAEQAKESKPE